MWFFYFEGHSQQVPQQIKDLIELTSSPNICVMQIGFNAGHSAEILLENNPTLKLTSFDLGHYGYVRPANQYIEMTYPGRHTLILGDSRVSLPEYIRNNPNQKFDVIFIDGGHDYPVANSDMENCMHLAHKDTIVIIDDTAYTTEMIDWWTVGPTQTWLEHIQQNKVIELGRVEYEKGRGMSWGKYLV